MNIKHCRENNLSLEKESFSKENKDERRWASEIMWYPFLFLKKAPLFEITN